MAQREDILMKMHEFYTQEARHQRSMMWETVKWFTPIITAILALWIKLYIDYGATSNAIRIILLSAGIFGLLFSVIPTRLLKSFYRSNLIYTAMFGKVEDELGFEPRTIIKSYKKDTHITYKLYLKDRNDHESTDDLVKKLTSFPKGFPHRMYFWMQSFFYLFFIAFLFAIALALGLVSFLCCLLNLG